MYKFDMRGGEGDRSKNRILGQNPDLNMQKITTTI